jgi:hypothetical protein
MSRSFYAIYLQTGGERQAQSLEELTRFARSTFAALPAHVVIVDNALGQSREERRPGRDSVQITLIDGDNSCREFSGMDKGLRWIGDRGGARDDSVVLLVNDTWLDDLASGDFFRLNGREALRLLDSGHILGQADWFAEPVQIFGIAIAHWIKSNFVLARFDVLKQLAPLSLPAACDGELFETDSRELFRRAAPLSPAYRQIVTGFLQGTPNPSLWRWPRAESFNADNIVRFRLKAKAILSEHHLSARAAARGFTLTDICRRRFPSKRSRARFRQLLYYSGAWRLVPRFRNRFGA